MANKHPKHSSPSAAKRRFSKGKVAARESRKAHRTQRGMRSAQVDLPPYHPIRIVLDAATQEWRLSLLHLLRRERVAGVQTLPNLDKLARVLLRHEFQNFPTLIKKLRTIMGGRPPPPDPQAPPSPIELNIEAVDPPASWPAGQTLRVAFNVLNKSGQPTSGFVRGDATQGTRTLVSSRWFQPGAIVSNLPPGQAFIGLLKMDRWTIASRTADSVDINLQYWVEDPNGTITFFWKGFPGDPQRTATYGAISFAEASLSAPISFAADVRPLFRDKDIQAMKRVQSFPIDLSSYAEVSVKKTADAIYAALSDRTGVINMPCDGHWPADWLETFRLWNAEGRNP